MLCRLRSFCLPAFLHPDEINQLDGIVEHNRLVLAHRRLYHPGERFSAIFAVLSGAVKTYKTGEDGRDCVIGFHLPGELFGFSGIGERRHPNGAEALVDTWVCELPFDELERICQALPSLQSRILHLMSEQIVGIQAHLAELHGTRAVRDRLAMFLVSLSSRAARRGESATRVQMPMTGRDIGDYLGISAEAVSRGFAQLARENVICKRGREITIQDPERLREVACRMLESGTSG